MSLKCCDCQSPISKQHKNGPAPKRCATCKKNKACRNAKAWALAHHERIKARNKAPRHTECVDCGQHILRAGKRGPLAKRCVPCHAAFNRKRNQQRYATRKKQYRKQCEQCGNTFNTDRKKQKTCSKSCRAKSKRTRFTIVCANTPCKKTFEVTPATYAKGTRCCSDKCKHEQMRLPDAFCQNPACGKKIERESQGPRKAALGQDGRKYCCRECAWDHRWGANRPRGKWSKKHLAASAAGALQTSLRKKCKLLGVPHDEQCTRRAVLERDNWICQMCRVECNREYVIEAHTRRPDPRNAEHDHIVPLTEAGSPGNVFPNSQCLCRKCNNKKRAHAWGQLRLDLEGSVKRWESGARGRRQRNSSCSGATQAAAL